LEEVKKWLLNYARNANNPIPVVSAITTKRLNVPRRLLSMKSPNRLTSHQKKRKIEVRYDCNGATPFPEPCFIGVEPRNSISLSLLSSAARSAFDDSARVEATMFR
jgi:hypothetical protein